MRRHSVRGAALPLVLGAVLAVVAVALFATQTWLDIRREGTAPVARGFKAGELCSVLLVNGQVYYGEFAEGDARHVALKSVYYVQTLPQAAGAPPNNRLVNRRKVDWHAPTLMSIPVDKILTMEIVGAG